MAFGSLVQNVFVLVFMDDLLYCGHLTLLYGEVYFYFMK